MINTSLCYIEKDGEYLMIHRNKKPGDYNKDKWIGIGGKFLEAESPEECVCREVLEETGVVLAKDKVEYCGIITFVCDNSLENGKTERYAEFMHLFHADFPSGADSNLPPCDEGDLEWVPISKMNDLPHWKGDEIFLELIARRPLPPFFSLKLEYCDGELLKATLNGKVLQL